jgi:hypothetical protein
VYSAVATHGGLCQSDMCKSLKKMNISLFPAYTTYEVGSDGLFRNVGTLNSDATESPKIKNTNLIFFELLHLCPVEQMKKKETGNSESCDTTVHITINHCWS